MEVQGYKVVSNYKNSGPSLSSNRSVNNNQYFLSTNNSSPVRIKEHPPYTIPDSKTPFYQKIPLQQDEFTKRTVIHTNNVPQQALQETPPLKHVSDEVRDLFFNDNLDPHHDNHKRFFMRDQLVATPQDNFRLNKDNDIYFKPFYQTNGKAKCLIGDLKNYRIPLLNFYKVDENVYRGGQPGFSSLDEPGRYDNIVKDKDKIKSDIEFLRDKLNIKTVLNLRHKGETNLHEDLSCFEEKVVEELNNDVLNGNSTKSFIRYINKPLLNENMELSRESILPIINIIKNKDNYPIYIHCSEGRDRTGIVSALYRIISEKVNMKEVLEELIFTDYDVQKRHALVKDLIDLLDAKLDKLPEYYAQHFQSIRKLKNLTPKEFESYGNILKKLFEHKI